MAVTAERSGCGVAAMMTEEEVYAMRSDTREVFDVQALCVRWGASEAQVLALANTDECFMLPDHCLRDGKRYRPMWSGDTVHAIESHYLPELARRDATAALQRLQYVTGWADRVYPVTELPAEAAAVLSEHAFGEAADARFSFIHDQLEHTRPA